MSPGDAVAAERLPTDPLGAFVARFDPPIAGKAGGPLAGLAFAAKDLFDVAGHVTGCGSPDWARTHPPARANAAAVQRLLDAGAALVGKTLTDEMAFSLTGENVHYGTPVNPRVPDRVPGGSSSGSASAVAGGLVDFALGSDTGGSVRVPAHCCGILGIRPTHGRVPLDGVSPLSPSFDTVGWLTRSGALLERIGRVLLDGWREPRAAERVIIADDLFTVADPEVRRALEPALHRVLALVRPRHHLALASTALFPGGPDEWFQAYRIIQAREAWAAHGGWITETSANLGPGVRDRFQFGSTVTDGQLEAATAARARIRARLAAVIGPGDVLCLPTAPCPAPLKGAPAQGLDPFRIRTMQLTCPAGLGGLPQVSLPLARIGKAPIGLGLMAAAGGDELLLGLARQLVP